MTANVPMIATGTAIKGITADRQFCKNSRTTIATRITASRKRIEDLRDRFADVRRRVVADDVIEALGKALLELFHLGHDYDRRHSSALASGS